MYQYDEYDQRIIDERVRQFEGQVERRLDGDVTENEFKPLRLQNGLYMQLHAYMLRIAVPYGLLSSAQLRKLGHIARTYDRGYGHITTRQNVQFNWPSLDKVPKILEELASVQMHAVQTSGNCIRNVTSDPFAGVAPDELEDPRPYAELIRQWSTFHPEFAYLPRKFKIAVTGTPTHDRAAIRYHDIGIRIVDNEQGERGFQIWVGGGMGRTPHIGVPIRQFVPYEYLLSYLESVLRVYNRYGRRDNKFKARIKITVRELGEAEFARRVEADWEQSKDNVRLDRAEIERIAAFFAPPPYETLPAAPLDSAALSPNRDYARWVQRNVQPHKVPGYKTVVIALKHENNPPGDVSDTQFDAIADLADEFSFGRAVAMHTQNIALTDVPATALKQLYERLEALDMATGNYGQVTDIICCPGLDFCALANARSIPLALELAQKLEHQNLAESVGDCSLKISGCINACGHHHVGNIGILGIDKHGKEAYQLTLGGHDSDDASIGKILGPAFDEEGVVGAVQRVLEAYLRLRLNEAERFLDCYRRVGSGPFKEAAYAAGTHAAD
jgi:sulfite reductase (NADPH) hemoprotein beta-component